MVPSVTSFSGQCLMSSILGGRAAIVEDVQPCRLPYQVRQENGSYSFRQQGFLSTQSERHVHVDLLPDILEAGVTSLKIEGRMKQLLDILLLLLPECIVNIWTSFLAVT